MDARAAASWVMGRGEVALDRPRILGILNITPDSFYDGGLHAELEAAVAHAGRLLTEGADLLDVGGESTRPGAQPVPAEREAERVLPVVRELARRFPGVPLSVDTSKAEVARAALAEGAWIINDVTGFRLDAELPGVVLAARAGVILMHSRGDVGQMASYDLAAYGPDPAADIARELGETRDRALAAGVRPEAVVLDPGLGFAKRTEHSLAVLARLDRILALGRPVLLGPSRKRFVGEVAGGLPPAERLEGTLAACVAGLLAGARIFRVHDVAPVRRALAVAEALRRAR
jgi:dihydropteroate synthase